MAILRGYRKNLLSNDAALLVLGIMAVLVSLPNPLFSGPLVIFAALVPLFYLGRGRSVRARLFLNLIFIAVVSLAAIIPLDLNRMVFSAPNLLLLAASFAVAGFFYAACLAFAGINPLLAGAAWAAAGCLLSLFSFPLPIETALVPLPLLLQSARVLGAGFISFLIVSANSALANLLAGGGGRRTAVFSAVVGIGLLANLIYGAVCLSRREAAPPKVKIAIIQPNVTPNDFILTERSRLFGDYFAKRNVFLTKAAARQGARLVIWPELAGNFTLQNDKFLGYLRREIAPLGAETLIGTGYIDYAHGRRLYNSAFILKRDGSTTELYKKTSLFPFIETARYSKGGAAAPLPSGSGLGRVGAHICLESIYPSIPRKLVQEGAGALALISSDALFGNSIIPYAHKALAALRAIENNRYAVHAGNAGPSAVFDNKGRLLVEIPYNKTAYANVNIAPLTEETIYTRFGDWFGGLCVVITFGNILLNLIRIKSSTRPTPGSIIPSCPPRGVISGLGSTILLRKRQSVCSRRAMTPGRRR
jgi:apolipoprotein N-acyltransferase